MTAFDDNGTPIPAVDFEYPAEQPESAFSEVNRSLDIAFRLVDIIEGKTPRGTKQRRKVVKGLLSQQGSLKSLKERIKELVDVSKLSERQIYRIANEIEETTGTRLLEAGKIRQNPAFSAHR